jgi:hypothetical protein
MSGVLGPELLPIEATDEETKAAEGEPDAPEPPGDPTPEGICERVAADAAPTGGPEGWGSEKGVGKPGDTPSDDWVLEEGKAAGTTHVGRAWGCNSDQGRPDPWRGSPTAQACSSRGGYVVGSRGRDGLNAHNLSSGWGPCSW